VCALQSNSYAPAKDLKKVKRQGFSLDRIMIVDDAVEKIVRQRSKHRMINPCSGQTNDQLSAIAEEMFLRSATAPTQPPIQ